MGCEPLSFKRGITTAALVAGLKVALSDEVRYIIVLFVYCFYYLSASTLLLNSICRANARQLGCLLRSRDTHEKTVGMVMDAFQQTMLQHSAHVRSNVARRNHANLDSGVVRFTVRSSFGSRCLAAALESVKCDLSLDSITVSGSNNSDIESVFLFHMPGDSITNIHRVRFPRLFKFQLPHVVDRYPDLSSLTKLPHNEETHPPTLERRLLSFWSSSSEVFTVFTSGVR